MNMTIAELKERTERHAQENGWALSEHADKILGMVAKNEGHCPCKKGQEDQLCPCPDHRAEIEQNGHCTCNLFLKPPEAKQFTSCCMCGNSVDEVGFLVASSMAAICDECIDVMAAIKGKSEQGDTQVVEA